MSTTANSGLLGPLRGMHEGSVDKAGRVKLSGKMAAHLSGFELFWITTLDERTVRIYPMPEWMETEKMLTSAQGEQAAKAKNLLFLANYYGDEAKIDGSNRMTIPTTLRKKLGLEDAAVTMWVDRGHVEVLTPQVIEERFTQARSGGGQDLADLEAAGMR